MVATKRVFLGGTCNESQWRSRMMIYLDQRGVEYFNPVVDDWDEEAMANELEERELCDFCMYTITPKMTGCYSIAEVVDDSNKKPAKTIFVLLRDDDGQRFDKGQWKSLNAVSRMVALNGAKVFHSLEDAAIGLYSMAGPTTYELVRRDESPYLTSGAVITR